MANWGELLESDEHEVKKRQIKNKQPIQATINWGKTKTEPESDTEQGSSASEQPKRNGNAPEYYGNPVMICGVESLQERENIVISSDEN